MRRARQLRRHDGKVRDCYIDAAAGERVIIVSDRLSAFDAVVGTIPCKGQVLSQLALHWFEATRHLAPNHVIASPDPNVLIARERRPLPAEFVMRGYLTGVTSTRCGAPTSAASGPSAATRCPTACARNQALPAPILTPSTKAGARRPRRVGVARGAARGGELSADEFDVGAGGGGAPAVRLRAGSGRRPRPSSWPTPSTNRGRARR
ncbi:MAG: phosphoribosylaminoimidazolesuccinocarboxamide synthase [Kofleriaceae bacterium]